MPRMSPYSLVAGLLVGAACSHAQTPSERTQAAAESSQQAFRKATDDEKKVEEQQKRVEAARQDTAKAQRSLQDAQRREEQERSKAQQLQEQANRHLDEATQRARQAREATTPPQATQSVAGRVAEARPGQVVLQTPGGEMMPFRVDDRTRVLVGRDQRSAADIQRGADARVAYTGEGGQATALTIEVMPLDTRPPPSPGANQGTGSQTTATPVPSTPPPPR